MHILLGWLSYILCDHYRVIAVSSPPFCDISDLLTFDDVVRHHAAERPDAVAITFQGDDLTYADLDHLAQIGAELFHANDLRHGDRLAYIGKNSADFPILLAAAARSGIILAPLNWRLAPAELDVILEDMEPSAIFITEDYQYLTSHFATHVANAKQIFQPFRGPVLRSVVGYVSKTHRVSVPQQ